MNDTEPIYLKRPILSGDCLALAHITRMCGDTITPIEMQWHIKHKHIESLLYEHEIDGVAHPIAFATWIRKDRERAIFIQTMFCHLEYDGVAMYENLLSHAMRLVTPRHRFVILEGVESDDSELIEAANNLGFWNTGSTVFNGKTWLEFRYGVEV